MDQVLGVIAVSTSVMLIADALRAVWCIVTNRPWGKDSRVPFVFIGGACIVLLFYFS